MSIVRICCVTASKSYCSVLGLTSYELTFVGIDDIIGCEVFQLTHENHIVAS